MPLSDENIYKMFGPSSCAPDEIKLTKPKIYFIIAYCTADNRHRCFGYYSSLEAARNALLTMWKDIEECYYDSFFIESMEEGIHKIGNFVEYYEVDKSKRELILKDRPFHLHGVVNWSIG